METRFLELIWKVSLQAGAVAALVWIITRHTKRAPASFRYGLWVLVLVKFLVPPMVGYPSGLAFWQSAPAVESSSSVSGGPVAHGSDAVALEAKTSQNLDLSSAPGLRSARRQTTERTYTQAAVLSVNWGAILVGLWGAAACVQLALLMKRFGGRRRLLDGARDGGDELDGLLASAAEALKMRRLPVLLVSETVSTPTLVGVFRPVIVLPAEVVRTCDRIEIEAMLLHELAHVRRRDMLVLWLHQLVRALFFFHPAVWLAGHELELERETACDELVVNRSSISPADYAAGYVTALRLARRSSVSRASLAMAEPFEVGKRRLAMILRAEMPKPSVGWAIGLGLVVLLALPTFARVIKHGSAKPTHKLPEAHAVQASAETAKSETETTASELRAVAGPGVVITLVDSPKLDKSERDPHVIEEYMVHAEDILKIIDELRSSGAKAISVNGERIGAMSSVRCVGPAIMVNARRLSAPFKITAIGDKNTLAGAVSAKDGPFADLSLLDMITVAPSDTLSVPAMQPVVSSAALEGYEPMTGAGVTITLKDSPRLNSSDTDKRYIEEYMLHATDVSGVLNELKAAGAQAISVNGKRLTAVSCVSQAGPKMLLNGQVIAPPIVVRAIGDPEGLRYCITAQGGPAQDLLLLDMVSVAKESKITLDASSGGNGMKERRD